MIPPACNIAVEADSENEAIEILKTKGVDYFQTGCPCCGDRWYLDGESEEFIFFFTDCTETKPVYLTELPLEWEVKAFLHGTIYVFPIESVEILSSFIDTYFDTRPFLVIRKNQIDECFLIWYKY